MIDIDKNKECFKDRFLYYKGRIEDVVYPESEFLKINSVDYDTAELIIMEYGRVMRYVFQN